MNTAAATAIKSPKLCSPSPMSHLRCVRPVAGHCASSSAEWAWSSKAAVSIALIPVLLAHLLATQRRHQSPRPLHHRRQRQARDLKGRVGRVAAREIQAPALQSPALRVAARPHRLNRADLPHTLARHCGVRHSRWSLPPCQTPSPWRANPVSGCVGVR